MGFLGSLGRALTAPIRATNKIVGKSPGMQGVMGTMNKIPGMRTANKLNPMMMGLQQDPNLASKAGAGAGIGPSPAVAPVDPSMMPPDQTMMEPQMMQPQSPMVQPRTQVMPRGRMPLRTRG